MIHRLDYHSKRGHCSSKRLFEDNAIVKFELLAELKNITRKELSNLELKYIQETDCVNIAGSIAYKNKREAKQVYLQSEEYQELLKARKEILQLKKETTKMLYINYSFDRQKVFHLLN